MDIAQHDVEEETRRFFMRVYRWMFLGLAVSGGIAYYTASTPAIFEMIFSNQIYFFGLIIAEIVMVIALAGFIHKMSARTAIIVFFLYAAFTGLTLSVIFLVYTIESIAMTFFVTAAMFGALSLFGYFTKADLTSWGPILFMGLIGVIIASIVNMFLGNPQVDYIVSIIGVIVFTGLTAYDTQRIKKMNIIGNEGSEEDTKESIMGALRLYLDFINLFLRLLRFFGKRR